RIDAMPYLGSGKLELRRAKGLGHKLAATSGKRGSCGRERHGRKKESLVKKRFGLAHLNHDRCADAVVLDAIVARSEKRAPCADRRRPAPIDRFAERILSQRTASRKRAADRQFGSDRCDCNFSFGKLDFCWPVAAFS